MTAQQPYAVLVPYYSNLEYLRAALSSVLAQNDPNWWCVVVDDSPEATGDASHVAELVRDLSDSRVSYERNPGNLGVAGSFNRCFEIALDRGAELAVILHADDLLEADYVTVIRAAHAVHVDAVCVAPKVTVIDACGAPHLPLPDRVKAWLWPCQVERLSGERGLQLLLRGQFFYCPAVSYRTALVERPAWDARWKQVMDLHLYGRVLLGGGSIVLEPRRVYRYRRHEASQTQLNSATVERTAEETEVVCSFVDEARRRGWNRAARTGRRRATIRLQAVLQAGRAIVRGDLRAAVRAARLTVGR